MTSEADEKNAIRELLAEYCFEMDARRFANMAALFAPDGTWETAFGSATGRAAIEAQMRKLAPAMGEGPRAVHFNTNIVVKVQGDTATAVSNWLVAKNAAEGPFVESGGGYADQLIKQDGRWLFKHRTIDRFLAKGKMA